MNHEAIRTAAADAAYPHEGRGVDWSPHVWAQRRISPPVRTDETWRERAACRPEPGTDVRANVRIFYGGVGSIARVAKSICAGCPVKTECAAAGMYERFGTWGGLSQDDRQAKRAELRKAKGLSPNTLIDKLLEEGVA